MLKKLLLVSSLVFVGCSKNVEIEVPDFVQTMPFNQKINGPLISGGNVSDRYAATSDGTKIIYIADETTDNVDDLYVTTFPQRSTQNITNLSIGKKVLSFKVSPQDNKILFLADADTTGLYDLYTINLDGSNRQRVNIGLTNVTQEVENNFRFTNQGSKVIYATDEENAGVRNIYIANHDGSARLRLNQVLGTQLTFDLSANDSRVVYRTFSANPTLRSVTLSASGDTLLNAPFDLVGNPTSGVQDFKMASDSSRVAFRSNQDNGAIFELYTVNLDGSGLRSKINGTIIAGGIVSPTYDFSKDNTKVVYIADQNVDEVQEIYVSNAVAPFNNTKLNALLIANGNVTSFKLSSDGQKVLYIADQNIDAVNELYSVNLNGLSNTKINSNLSLGETVANNFISSGSIVIYAMDKGQSGFSSIYKNSLNGASELRLTQVISSGNGFFDLGLSTVKQMDLLADGSRVIVSGSSVGGNKQLFSVDLSGNNFKQINEASPVVLAGSNLGTSFLVLGNNVVYRADTGAKSELFLGLAKD